MPRYTTKEQLLEHIREKYERHEYGGTMGLDPGLRRMFTGIIVWPDKEYKITMKRNGFNSDSGYYQRERTRRKLRHAFDLWYNEMASEVSPMTADPEAYTRFRLRYFEQKQQLYETTKSTYLRLRKYIGVHRAATKFARAFAIGGKGRTLICIGNYKWPANSPIKGHVRSPTRLLVSKMQMYSDVLIVDEFRTTMLCSNCFSVLEKFKSPESYKFCPNSECSINWNRDFNAGINILYKGIAEITGEPLHPHFRRQPNYQPPRLYN